MRWAELLDVLTDSDRKREVVVERATETERLALFLLRREGWAAQIAPREVRHYSFEVSKPGARSAIELRNQRAKVHLGQIERFLDFLSSPNPKNLSTGLFISTSGFTPSVYAYMREEKISNLQLAIMRDNQLIFDCERIDSAEERDRPIYIGVFTCKGGVGKTTISAHLAGAFAMNGYDVALIDLDHQQNLRKILGDGVYLPATRGNFGSVVSVLTKDEWSEGDYRETKIVVCDCNPEFESNPREYIQKFDYCIVPTTLNPLGINKNADVIKRTLASIRRENQKAELFVLINSLQTDEPNRNRLLNEALKTQFKVMRETDSRLHYIDPAECAIRFSKQLLYWGYHLFDGSKPQLAFRTVGRYSYPRMDFLKLVDQLEMHTEVEKAKRAGA
ncbi:MAG: AAA family ATPase [Acidobacteria bacterium]|nr:AAA family ATPase [Acidobacteriota bacterium]MBK8148291.1 AAA family ATPase [Acidobacteriota bacterium]MBK8813428.1 AAA family ATPase [Acidobacteriota bacterium]